MYPELLSRCLASAVNRLHANLYQLMTPAAEPVWRWLTSLSGTESPVDYFQHPLAFPILLLPWWLEETNQPPDPAWQTDLIYSTINGYYYIRLLDNAMDNPAAIETKLLPAAAFFYAEFEGEYRCRFAADHPFWMTFRQIWLHTAVVTIEDASLTAPTAAQFEQTAAQKIGAVKIPLAATAHRYGLTNRLAAWNRLVEQLGGWHQLLNDLLGWHTDRRRQTATWFLAEAERQRRADESITAWIARQGLEWAIRQLTERLDELACIAAELNSPGLQQYLAVRRTRLNDQLPALRAGLRELVKLETALAPKERQ